MNPDSITIDRATLQDAQLQEVVELVAYNRERGKWCVHRDKNGKIETAAL